LRTPDRWDTARATVTIAVVTGLVWLVLNVFELQNWAIMRGSFVPADLTADFGLTRAPFLLTPLTATLLHADLFHLIFNLVIFLLCGRAAEGALGQVSLVILYVAGAFAAAGAQFALDPQASIPMIGASGAISAVIGAYAMLFGRNRVPVRDPRLALWLNVLWLLAAWVVLQVAMAIVLSAGQGILLAVGAHIGGFVVGVALARPLLRWRYRKA
jgi:membrane associated rhomboid family serine protease